MIGYNAPKDEGYQVSNSYGPIKQTQSNSYGNSQTVQVSLPIYNGTQQTSSRRSRCPRGAVLGKIGSCCGDQCNRACAIEAD